MNRLSSVSYFRSTLLSTSKLSLKKAFTRPVQAFIVSGNTSSPFGAPRQHRTMTSKISSKDFFDVFKLRHSVYGVKNTSKLSDDAVEKIVKDTLENYPNSYNYQTARVALITGQKSKQLWEVIINTAKGPLTAGMGEEGWKGFEPRLRSFQNSYGTVVFFDDEETIKKQQSDHPHIGSLFQQWADHANGIAEYMVWTTLSNEGVGASLQHLNLVPGVAEAIRKEFSLPDSWTPKAQLVYGDPSGDWPGQKDKLPFDQTLRVFK